MVRDQFPLFKEKVNRVGGSRGVVHRRKRFDSLELCQVKSTALICCTWSLSVSFSTYILQYCNVGVCIFPAWRRVTWCITQFPSALESGGVAVWLQLPETGNKDGLTSLLAASLIHPFISNPYRPPSKTVSTFWRKHSSGIVFSTLYCLSFTIEITTNSKVILIEYRAGGGRVFPRWLWKFSKSMSEVFLLGSWRGAFQQQKKQ